MKKYLKIVTNDLFNISCRIKQINPYYVVVRNLKTNCFEVHNTYYKNQSFEFSVPFEKLDFRTINYIKMQFRKTNLEKLKELENNNKKIEEKLKNNSLEESEYKLKEIYNYANTGSKTFEFDQGYKNNWI